jgi:hypothetical protein
MWEREGQALGCELLDVWAADVVGLFYFNDLDDLMTLSANILRNF